MLLLQSPRASQYRYDYQCFNKILEAIPKKCKAVICGDINLPSTNWDIFSSQENDEQEILEMLEDRLIQQSINFPTCGTNTLEVFLYQNCQVYSEHDENFDKIYDCSDHIAIRTAIELEHFDPPPAMTNFYSFGSGDYDLIVGAMKDRPFSPQCYTNVDNMYNELQDYLTDFIDTHIPKRTKYRQSLPPWITPSASHQMKMLNTQKRLLEKRPTSYRKNKVLKLESQITELCEHDRISYQEKIFGSRNCGQIYKHLKHINRASNIPKTIKFKDKMTSIPEEKVEMFNTFFHSVFSAKENYNFLDIKCKSPTHFSVSNKTISNILANIDTTKTRGPNGLPPVSYQRCGKQMSNILNKLFKNIKRIRKTPTS